MKRIYKNPFKLLTWMCRASQDAVAFQHWEICSLSVSSFVLERPLKWSTGRWVEVKIFEFLVAYSDVKKWLTAKNQLRCNYIVTTTNIDTPLVNFSSLSTHPVAFLSFYPHKNFLLLQKKKKDKKKTFFATPAEVPSSLFAFEASRAPFVAPPQCHNTSHMCTGSLQWHHCHVDEY